MIGWYDIGSIPEYCRKVSKRTVESWIREEGLRFVKIRGKRFVKREWLDCFLSEHEVSRNNEIETIVNEVVRDLQ